MFSAFMRASGSYAYDWLVSQVRMRLSGIVVGLE
jgi:hypothetical protein